MPIEKEFIRRAIRNQKYELSLHADDERIANGLTIYQLEFALNSCEIIEQYPDDSRGESCLALGFSPEGIPIHIVCGKGKTGYLFLITVYIPTMPKWRNPYNRNIAGR